MPRMRPKMFPLARMSVTSSGTGTITLGTAVSGFLTFDLAGASTAATGQQVEYAINDSGASEIGIGTYTSSALSLTRGSSLTGLVSTNSNSPINMSNAAQVFITPTAHVLNDITNKNRVLNPNFVIDQRNVGVAQTITAGAALVPTVDGWIAACTGGNVTGQQLNPDTAPGYQFTGAAGVTLIRFGQCIEARDCTGLQNQICTISFTASNSLLAVMTMAVETANAWDVFSARTQIVNTAFSVSATETQFTHTFNAGANGDNGIFFEFNVAAQTSGTWVIKDVQLERGAVATAFEVPIMATELVKCKRRYEKSFPYSVAVTAGTQQGIVFFPTGNNNVINDNSVGAFNFEVEKRGVPTITIRPFTTPTNTGRVSDNGGIDMGSSSGNVIVATAKGCTVHNKSGATIVASNNGFVCHYEATAEIIP